MKHTTFSMIAGIIFAVMAAMHLLRLTEGWPLIIDGTNIPLWVNWVGLVVASPLAYYGIRFGIRRSPHHHEHHKHLRIP